MQASKVGSIPDLDLEGVNSLRLFIRAFYFKKEHFAAEVATLGLGGNMSDLV